MSIKYRLDKKDLSNLAKVACYSGVTAFLAVIIGNLGNMEIPTQYAILIPIINTILVAVKDFFENRI